MGWLAFLFPQCLDQRSAAIPYICPFTTATVENGGLDIQEHTKKIYMSSLGYNGAPICLVDGSWLALLAQRKGKTY